MATQLSPKRAVISPSIPDRLYFKIGDVARICELETYVLRFWETQFPQLKPNKSGTGQRLYRRREVELALDIKRLVHAEGYTLAGARQALDQGHRHTASKPGRQRDLQPDTQSRLPLAATSPSQHSDAIAAAISQIRAELREIAGMLAAPDPSPIRRRSRLTAIRTSSGTLFPS
jgi:DNA-binding transcriptional MerR regulator